jgi:type II secretory pathway pseudopilin PulG
LRSEKGLTYLEILATMIIMIMALIPIMRIMPEGIKATRKIEKLTKAGFLAQSKMDEVRSQILGANPNYGFSKDYTKPSTTFPNPDAGFKYTVTDDQGTDIKELNITVWFDENDNDIIDTYSGPYQEDEIRIDLDTKIADRG